MRLCLCKESYDNLWKMGNEFKRYPEYMEGSIVKDKMYKYEIIGEIYHIHTMNDKLYALFYETNFKDAFYDKGIFRAIQIDKIL